MNHQQYHLSNLIRTDFEIVCESQAQQEQIRQILKIAFYIEWAWLGSYLLNKYIRVFSDAAGNQYTNGHTRLNHLKLVPPALFILHNTTPLPHPHESVGGWSGKEVARRS